MALAGIDVVRQQHVANTLSQVLLVFFAGRPRFGWNRARHVVEQLAGPPDEAQAHDIRVGRLRVHYQHVFQVGQVLARHRADAPHLLQPGVVLTFFNILRIVSSEIAAT